MKITLYAAISIDGFIATENGNSDWVSEIDTPFFKAEMEKAGCIIIGRKTYEQFEGIIYPVKGVFNIVMTRTKGIQSKYDNLVFTNEPPKQVIEIAKARGFDSVLLVGGGHMNGAFLQEGLIDEIIVDVHPLMLGSGIKMCENAKVFQKFEKVAVMEIDKGLILARYKMRTKT